MKNLILLSIVFVMVSCASKKEMSVFTYWVNSSQVDCAGAGPMKCMLIQKGDKIVDGEWQTFYSKIEGFDFNPGYIYKLKVKEEVVENPPADGSSIKYSLVELVAKKEDKKLLLNGKWETLKINGSDIKQKSTAKSGKLPSINIDIAKMQISGTDGCNNFTGGIKSIAENSIILSPLAGTKKMCLDMTIPDEFNKTLATVKSYEVDTNKLSLMNEAGNVVLELNKGIEPKTKIHDIWVAENIGGEAVKANAPRLEVFSAKMEVIGNDGCNDFRGKLTKLTNTEIEFSPLASTRKMCPNMSISNKFNQTIDHVRKYKIENLRLILLDANGNEIMTFRKTD